MQKKSGNQELAKAASEASGQEQLSGLSADRMELHAAVPANDLPGSVHPEITVWKSTAKITEPAPVPDLPSGNATGFIKLTPAAKNGFIASVFFSPNAVSNNVASNKNMGGPPRVWQNDPNAIKNEEQNGSSWSVGVLLGYHVNPHWSIESGLILTTRITMIQPKTIYARPDDRGNIRYLFDCSSGFSYIDLKQSSTPFSGDSAKAVSSKNKLQYLSVPIALKYHFGTGKLQFYTGFGLQTNFLASRKIDTYISKGNTREYANTSDIQGLRSAYVSGLLSAGVSYSLKNITASVTPNAQIGMMSINKNAPVKSYINFYGIAAGISIKL